MSLGWTQTRDMSQNEKVAAPFSFEYYVSATLPLTA